MKRRNKGGYLKLKNTTSVFLQRVCPPTPSTPLDITITKDNENDRHLATSSGHLDRIASLQSASLVVRNKGIRGRAENGDKYYLQGCLTLNFRLLNMFAF